MAHVAGRAQGPPAAGRERVADVDRVVGAVIEQRLVHGADMGDECLDDVFVIIGNRQGTHRGVLQGAQRVAIRPRG